jgi:hypothetical protein
MTALAGAVAALIDLDGAAVRVLGHDAATPGHLLVLGQDRRSGLRQLRDRTVQGVDVEAREQAAAGPALDGPARHLGRVDREGL